MRKVFLECGCCGCYHLEDFYGDCRDDDNRFRIHDNIPSNSIIIPLEDQEDE